MHSKIHGYKNDSWNGIGGVAMPAIQEHSDMVIPVWKHEFLLVNDNEESIEKLGKFAHGKKENPESRGSSSHRGSCWDAKILPKSHGNEIV